jgi:hypothetical protein
MLKKVVIMILFAGFFLLGSPEIVNARPCYDACSQKWFVECGRACTAAYDRGEIPSGTPCRNDCTHQYWDCTKACDAAAKKSKESESSIPSKSSSSGSNSKSSSIIDYNKLNKKIRAAKKAKDRQNLFNSLIDQLKSRQLHPVEVPCKDVSDHYTDSILRKAHNSRRSSKDKMQFALSEKNRLIKVENRGKEVHCYGYTSATPEEGFKKSYKEWQLREARRLNSQTIVESRVPCPKEVRDRKDVWKASKTDVVTIEHSGKEIRVISDNGLRCYGYSAPSDAGKFGRDVEDKIKCPQGIVSDSIDKWENLDYGEDRMLHYDVKSNQLDYTYYLTKDGMHCFSAATGGYEVASKTFQNEAEEALSSKNYDDLYTTLERIERVIPKLEERGANPELIEGLKKRAIEIKAELEEFKKKRSKSTSIEDDFESKSTKDVSVELDKAKKSLFNSIDKENDVFDLENKLAEAQGKKEAEAIAEKLKLVEKEKEESWFVAKSQYRDVLFNDPNNVEANFALAKMLKSEGRYNEARQLYRKAFVNAKDEDSKIKLREAFGGPGPLFDSGQESIIWTLAPLQEYPQEGALSKAVGKVKKGAQDEVSKLKRGVEEQIEKGWKKPSDTLLRLRAETNNKIHGVTETLKKKAYESETMSRSLSYIRLKRLNAMDIYKNMEKQFLKAQKDYRSMKKYEPLDETKDLIERGIYGEEN